MTEELNIEHIVGETIKVLKAAEADEAAEAQRQETMREEIRKEERTKLEAEVKTWRDQKGVPAIKSETQLGSGGAPEQGPNEAFGYWMATGDKAVARAELQEADGEAIKALGESTGDGAYLVPSDNSDRIVELRDAKSWPRMAGVDVIPTSRDVIDIPAEDLAVSTMTHTAEGSDSASDDPSFAQNQVTVENWTTAVTVSNAMLEDEDYGFVEYYNRRVARFAALTEAYYCAIGSGSNQHQGVFEGGDTDALVFDTDGGADSDGNLLPDALYALYYTLGEGFRDGAIWLMNGTSERLFRALKTTAASPNFAFNEAGAAVEMINGRLHFLGRPVFNQASIPDKSSGVGFVAFGNPEYYALVERRGFVVARNPYIKMSAGQTVFYATMRQSGKVTAESAWAIGVGA